MENSFSHKVNKDGKVFLFRNGRQVKVLKDRAARTFTAKIAGLDEEGRQLLTAKATGDFRRGNERESKGKRKNL